MMRQTRFYTLALGAFLTLAAIHPLFAEVEEGGAVKVDACASDPKKLGLSRIVEIDTADGAKIGGSEAGATHFLKDGEVVLTFDDGPIKAYTRDILKALADQCTKATFFMVGRMAVNDAETVREVAAAGHTVGSHTWSHRNLRPTTLVTARSEIESAISAISKAKGAPIAPLFRFPYLSASRQAEDYLKSRNIAAIWVDIDSKDYLTRDPKVVERRIMSQLAVEKKGIILMHDIHAWTAKMLPDLLNDLRDHGFKIVHMVPKTTVETVAAFDAAAEKVMAAKTAARAANPIVAHSMVWSMTPTPEPVTGSDAAPAHKQNVSAHGKRIGTKPSIAEGIPDDDSPAPIAPNARPRKVTKAKSEDLPWQLKMFSN